MKYRAIFKRTADGRWLADIPEVPGCSVSGRTIAEARARVTEAPSVHVDDVEHIEPQKLSIHDRAS